MKSYFEFKFGYLMQVQFRPFYSRNSSSWIPGIILATLRYVDQDDINCVFNKVSWLIQVSMRHSPNVYSSNNATQGSSRRHLVPDVGGQHCWYLQVGQQVGTEIRWPNLRPSWSSCGAVLQVTSFQILTIYMYYTHLSLLLWWRTVDCMIPVTFLIHVPDHWST